MQAVNPAPVPRRLNPSKLLLSKWTAVTPRGKERHFLVTKLLLPEYAGHAGRMRRTRSRDLPARPDAALA